MTQLVDALDLYPAWKLSKYTQPFEDGKVQDKVYVCQVCDGEEWHREEYAHYPELAINRALDAAAGGKEKTK